MKFRGYIILLLLCAFFIAGQAMAAEAESFSVNGLKVIFKKNTATDIVAAHMYFRGGATVLTPEKAGIERFALIVAQKATKNFPKDKLNADLERMNSRVNSATNRDFSSLSLLCVKQNLEKSWEIFSDMMLNPLFTKEDVELEKQKLVSAIKQNRDNPDAFLNELMTQNFFINHPYLVDVNGTEESVSAFTPEDLKSYLKNRMTTSQMLLVVVGNTTKDQIREMASKSFGSLQAGTFKAMMPPAVKHPEPSLKIVSRELPTTYIRGTFPAPAYGTKDSYAMRLAGSILRDRVFEEVRTKRGLSYAPAAGSANAFSNYGYIYVTAVDPDSTIGVMINELRKIKQNAVEDKVLKDKVNVFITSYYMGNETNQSQANLLARYELSGAGYAESAKFIDHTLAVTTKDIQEVCQKYIENLQFVLLGNPPALAIEKFMF